MLLICRRNVI